MEGAKVCGCDAAALIQALHGRVVRAASARAGRHFQGLQAAASWLRAAGPRSPAAARLGKKLRALDNAAALCRHITDQSSLEFLAEADSFFCSAALLTSGATGGTGSSPSLLQHSSDESDGIPASSSEDDGDDFLSCVDPQDLEPPPQQVPLLVPAPAPGPALFSIYDQGNIQHVGSQTDPTFFERSDDDLALAEVDAVSTSEQSKDQDAVRHVRFAPTEFESDPHVDGNGPQVLCEDCDLPLASTGCSGCRQCRACGRCCCHAEPDDPDDFDDGFDPSVWDT